MLDANITNQPKHGYVVTVGVQWGLEALLDLNFWGERATNVVLTVLSAIQQEVKASKI